MQPDLPGTGTAGPFRLPAAAGHEAPHDTAWQAAAPPRDPGMTSRGIRHSRTAANWTAAALIAGVAAATGYFAHHPAGQATGTAQVSQHGSGVHGTGGHVVVGSPIATSGGSGVSGAGGSGGSSGAGWRDN
jgi:hypothetical protein